MTRSPRHSYPDAERGRLDRRHRRGVAKALADADVDYEIVVVDDSSTDGTEGVVRELAAENEEVRYRRSQALSYAPSA